MSRENLIQTRRGTASQWAEINPTLQAGEMGFETNTSRFKVGDGDTAWNLLEYVRFDGGNIDPTNFSKSTAVGTNVLVDVVGQYEDRVGMTIQFPTVSSGGTTEVSQLYNYNTLELPTFYSLENTVYAFTITTTAVFSGDALVKFVLPQSITELAFNDIRIFKYSSGVTTDVTVLSGPNAPSFATRTIYASVSSFSEFYIIPRYTDPCKYGKWEGLGFSSYADCSANYVAGSSSSEGVYYPSMLKKEKDIKWNF